MPRPRVQLISFDYNCRLITLAGDEHREQLARTPDAYGCRHFTLLPDSSTGWMSCVTYSLTVVLLAQGDASLTHVE